MSILPISRIKPGMKLEQAVYSSDGKCLLTAGAVITNRNIEKFRERLVCKKLKYQTLLNYIKQV